jgi:cyclopropane fatty-acyl-phospholipid synthase-like methyltransferase
MQVNDVSKPYAESCDQNREPILDVLKRQLHPGDRVLEIGSGTGQHAVHFGAGLPQVQWQTSDLAESHAGIRLWLDEAALENVLPPIELDALNPDHWPDQGFDAVFSANTAHIMPESAVAAMLSGVAGVLRSGGRFLLYGPFKYDGEHTAESNLRFDHWLKAVEPRRGVRDVTWMKQVAGDNGLELDEDIEMPVNNRILVWVKR